MAESKDVVNVAKQSLSNTVFYRYQLRGSKEFVYMSIQLNIERYYQLKNNTRYAIKSTASQNRLVIIKTRRGLKLEIISDKCRALLKSCLKYDDDTFSVTVYPMKNDRCECNGVLFPSSVISDDKNVFLKSGNLRLLLIFEYLLKPFRSICLLRGSNRDKNQKPEQEIISKSLRIHSAYKEKNNFSDFVIYVDSDEREFHVQKAILAARSQYLDEYLKSAKGEARICMKLFDTNHEAVALTLDYLYCGKICEIKGLKAVEDILKLSLQLQIESLKKLCTDLLISNITPLTIDSIMAVGKRLGIEKIVEAVKNFVP